MWVEAVGGCEVSTVCGNSHYTFKWDLPCVMYQALFLFYMQISPWNHSLIMEIKPTHIYMTARLYHSSRLNICFPGCHRVSGEPCATCSVSGRRMIAGKWEWRKFHWEFGGTLACSLNSHCAVEKPETSGAKKKRLMRGSQHKTLRGVSWKSQLFQIKKN